MGKEYISLSTGSRYKLKVPYDAIWTCDNSLIEIKGQGWINPTKDALYPNSIANIVATEISGSRTQEFRVTIVNWSANARKLEIQKRFEKAYNITKHNDKLYVSIRGTGLELFESYDNLETLTKVCDLPEPQWYAPMLITPAGYFIRSQTKIWKSTDLVNWSLCMTATTGSNLLMHAFDWYYNSTTGKTYVFTGEYDTDATYRHKVYRGIIDSDGTESWGTILEFYSRNELISNPNLSPACWHIHMVIVDKKTGYLFVGTGDYDNESQIMYSKDYGSTWSLLGKGSQEWRTLSMWFTNDYIYWNMDSAIRQKIFRIPRTWLSTKSVNEIEKQKEVIATLDCSAMWYHVWGKDDANNDVVYMCTSAEGTRRDYNARVLMIKEEPKKVVVEEVFLVTSSNPDVYSGFLQMEPYAFNNGYLFMNGRATDWQTTWKFKLKRYTHNILYRFVNPKFI